MFQCPGLLFLSPVYYHMQVLVRTRPVSSSEASGTGFTRCIRQDGPHTITWLGHPETRFTFDHVAGESVTQVHIEDPCCSALVRQGLEYDEGTVVRRRDCTN